ncbi:MAG TPA: hypothetical protein VMT95_06610 [Candidatus Binatia bacterium]|nr:hypothetical protein [Candidatus Binatia bacterium]
MRAFSVSFSIAVAAALLASCAGGSMSSSVPGADSGAAKYQALRHAGAVSIIPRSTLPKVRKGLRGRRAPAAALKGIYAADFYANTILGYPKNNVANGPPICSESGPTNVNDLATDTIGNLMVPAAFAGVFVYTGPQMCGRLMATITDTYGQASDAAAVNAATGPIVVGNILGPGYVVTCTVASLSCAQLTPSSQGIGEVAGVGMDKNGNCWADAYNAAFTAVVLTYWAGCSGTGVAATGFQNTGYGGVDVDNYGDIITFNWRGTAGSDLWVYSGCNPACTSVSDDSFSNGPAIFGHLGRQSQRLVVGNYLAIQVDIYAYTPTSLTYLYSFNNGLGQSGDIEGAAYSPSSKK